jgi:Tfp pilus assembly protein PilF
VIASGSGDDRPSYFESMTANVTRGWAPLRGVLVGREKYIDLPITELYDLTRDPEETSNIATVRTGRTEVLVNVLKGFDMTPPGRPREETPETLERLRSLGYVGGGTATVHERYTDDDDPKRLIELEQTMHLASEAYQDGRSSDAIGLYRSVIAKRSDTEDAYRQLALIYWRDGRPAEAISTLERALKNGVTQSEVRIKLGQYLAQSGQPAKAIALLESFGSDDPDALVALGNAYELAGRLPDAAKTFRHLIEIDPNNGLGYQNLGIAQLQLKDDAGAETFLRKAIDLDPSLSGAYTALGVVLTNTNRKSEAIDVWKRAVELDRSNFDALFNLTKTLFDAGRFDEAHTYGDRFLATAPPALQSDIETIKKLLGKD